MLPSIFWHCVCADAFGCVMLAIRFHWTAATSHFVEVSKAIGAMHEADKGVATQANRYHIAALLTRVCPMRQGFHHCAESRVHLVLLVALIPRLR